MGGRSHGLRERAPVGYVRSLAGACEQDRDVVVAASRIGQVDQLTDRLRPRLTACDLQDLGVAHEVGEAVAGQHEHVSGRERQRLRA